MSLEELAVAEDASPEWDRFAASSAQQRLWFLEQYEPGRASYNIPLACRLSGVLRADVLHRAVQEIVHRHEVLRTRFAAADDGPEQVVADEMAIDMPLIDFSGFSAKTPGSDPGPKKTEAF